MGENTQKLLNIVGENPFNVKNFTSIPPFYPLKNASLERQSEQFHLSFIHALLRNRITLL